MAIKLLIVSKMVSPLDCDEVATFKLMTSAESLLAAISKVVLVLVLFSKKTLHTVFPLNIGTFLTSLSPIFKNDSAVSNI